MVVRKMESVEDDSKSRLEDSKTHYILEHIVYNYICCSEILGSVRYSEDSNS